MDELTIDNIAASILNDLMHDLVAIKAKHGAAIDKAISKLNSILQQEENLTIEFHQIGDATHVWRPDSIKICLGDFNEKLYSFSSLLATRIAVDSEQQQVTIIGTNNVIDF